MAGPALTVFTLGVDVVADLTAVLIADELIPLTVD